MLIFVAAQLVCCGPDESPASAEPAIVRYLTHPEGITLIDGEVRELHASRRLVVRLEQRASSLGLPIASLPWPALEESFELRCMNGEATRLLRRGDLREFAAGQAEYTVIEANRRLYAHDCAHRGGRFASINLEAHHEQHQLAPDHFVFEGKDAALGFILPVIVEAHVLELSYRWRGERSKEIEVTIEVGHEAAAIVRLNANPREAQPDWHKLRIPLTLKPGLERFSIGVNGLAEQEEFDLAWVELQQAERDLIVWSSKAQGEWEASYLPASLASPATLHAGVDGLLFTPHVSQPIRIEAIDPDVTCEVQQESNPNPALDAYRIKAAPGWLRLYSANGADIQQSYTETEELWRESQPVAPDDALLAHVLAKCQIDGDRRPSFWLPAGSVLEHEAEIAGGDRLRFSVGSPDVEGVRKPQSTFGDSPKIRFQVSWMPAEGEPLLIDDFEYLLSNGDQRDRWVEREIRFSEAVKGPGILRWKTSGSQPIAAAFANPRLIHAKGQTEDKPNLLVYTVDTLRFDHLSTYGARNPTSPNIDRLAQTGFRFDNFYAVAPWTRPTTATFLTGYYPYWHGMGFEQPLPFSLKTMAESLAENGYSTWAAVANPQVGGRNLQFSQGFERFVDHTGVAEVGAGATRASSSQINSIVLPWLETVGDEPFFLYLHSLDPHAPYAPPPDAEAPFGRDYAGPMLGQRLHRGRLLALADEIGPKDVEYVEDVYDNEIRYQDKQIGELLDALEELSLLESTVVVLLSDHGEEFREHGEWTHGYRMWEELLHVPLVLWLPSQELMKAKLTPHVIEALVSQVDFMPGLLALLGANDAFPRHGRSWLPLLSDSEAQLLPLYAQSFQTWEGDQIGSFRRNEFKLSWTYFEAEQREVPSLYNLKNDPGEHRDLASARPELVEELQAARDALIEFNARIRSRLDAAGFEYVLPASAEGQAAIMTPEEIAELEALGYVQTE